MCNQSNQLDLHGAWIKAWSRLAFEVTPVCVLASTQNHLGEFSWHGEHRTLIKAVESNTFKDKVFPLSFTIKLPVVTLSVAAIKSCFHQLKRKKGKTNRRYRQLVITVSIFPLYSFFRLVRQLHKMQQCMWCYQFFINSMCDS